MATAPTPEQHLLDTLRADEARVRAAEVRKIRTAMEWAIAHEVHVAGRRDVPRRVR